MTVFWIVAAALAAVALFFVLPPLLRRAPPALPAGERAGSNLAVLREQRAQLDAERAAGRLDDAQHAQGAAEIERRLLEEEGSTEAPAAAPARALRTALLLGLGLPLVAAGLYARLGQPDALSAPSAAAVAADAAASAAEVQALVDALAQRMANEPDNAEGWLLLARSFAVTERYKEASEAYARVVKLIPPDAQLLADYADVLAVAQGRSAAGEPTRLIEQALQLDPGNLKALAMAGHAAFDRGDFAAAAGHWERAGAIAPEGAFKQAMARGADEARAAGGLPPAAAGASAPAPTAPAARAEAAAPGPQIAGRVRIAAALAAQVAPTDTVFVFARAVEGPRMPLAIRRYPASALPLEFTLDDSTAMSPELRLSKFERVVVGARVSKSGNATPQPGDLLTQSEPLAPGRRDLELVIDRVQP